MKKSRILAGLVSAALMCSAVPASAANADGAGWITDSAIEEYFSDWINLEDMLNCYRNANTVFEFIFVKPIDNNPQWYKIYLLDKAPDRIFFDVHGKIDLTEFSDALAKIDKDLEVKLNSIHGSNTDYIITKKKGISVPQVGVREISEQTANAIYALVKDKAYKFIYNTDFYYSAKAGTNFNLFLPPEDKTVDELGEEISNYLAENDKDIEVSVHHNGEEYEINNQQSTYWYNEVMLNYDDDVTLEEKLSLAKGICNNTGAIINQDYPESGSLIGGTDLDFCRIGSGDANCDEKIDIADAVLIMQFLANPEKYPMTEEGMRYADIIGNDGVTALDALQVQMIEAGSIS